MSTRMPALGLEDTAARIVAACAVREALQVDPWEASLPEPDDYEPWASDRAASTLREIACALPRLDTDQGWAINGIRHAAAEVRSWRLSLPDGQQGAPVDLGRPRPAARVALRKAIRALADADMSGGSARGRNIRYAEAYLRTAGEALIASGAE